MAAALLGESLLLDPATGASMPAASLDCDVLALYFSAQWCIGSLAFSRDLSTWSKTIQAKIAASGGALPTLEVIFVSSDLSRPIFDEHCAGMPFRAVDFAERALRNELAQRFDVVSIPSLVFLRRDGSILTRAGRNLISYRGKFYPWDKHEPHEHVLVQWISRGSTVCDVCGLRIPQGDTEFSCRPCNYDECAACRAAGPPAPEPEGAVVAGAGDMAAGFKGQRL